MPRLEGDRTPEMRRGREQLSVRAHGGSFKGARTLKRIRRTKAEMEMFDRQLIDLARADHPQSVRHLFYQTTDPRLAAHVEKSEHGYRKVQQRVAQLRQRGLIPFSWITDASRHGYHVATYEDGADFLRSNAGAYRADIWRDAGVYCEVWVESRSIAGVIHDECRRLAVSLYPSGGFTSISFAYQAAEYIRDYARGRPVVVFYIGDYDPAGVLIDTDIEKKLKLHLGEGISLDFRRIGITAEQIAEFDLPLKPRKMGDRRAPHIKHTVEAEAMPAHILRALLRHELETLLPPDAVEVASIEERSVRAYLDELADLMEAA